MSTETTQPANAATQLDESSVELLLKTAENEYNHENGRIASHDAKMNIMLPTSIAYLLAILSMNDLAKITFIEVNNVAEAIMPVIVCVAYSVSVFASILAIIMMLIALLPQKYIAIDTKDFYNPAYLDPKNQTVFKLHLYQRYVDATNYNRERNNQRMKLHKKACICMIISILAIVMYNIIKAFLLKGE